MRLIDFLKSVHITCLFTSLSQPGTGLEQTSIGISSLMDTWISLKDIESNGERNRTIAVLKSRGMAHSNQVREFRLTNSGVQLTDVYLGPGGVLMGAARAAHEARERAAAVARQDEIERQQRGLRRKRQTLEAQVGALRAELEEAGEELMKILDLEQLREQSVRDERTRMGTIRKTDRFLVAAAAAKSGRQKAVARHVKTGHR
jgi:circadian clock protein KaiC